MGGWRRECTTRDLYNPGVMEIGRFVQWMCVGAEQQAKGVIPTMKASNYSSRAGAVIRRRGQGAKTHRP